MMGFRAEYKSSAFLIDRWVYPIGLILLMGVIALTSVFFPAQGHAKFLTPKFLTPRFELQGLVLQKEGPNCWNSALINAGIIDSIRYVSQAEYWFWMNSPYCARVSPTKELRTGDLGAMIWPRKGHLHSFTYINDKMVFSKNSPSTEHPYKTQAFEAMFFPAFQANAKKCGVRPQSSKKEGGTCRYEIIYHRCDAIEAGFYSKDPQLRLMDQQIKKYEGQVKQWVQGGSAISNEEYARVIEGLYAQWMILKRHALPKEIPSDLAFRRRAMELRLVGLLLSDTYVAQSIPRLRPLVRAAYDFQVAQKPKKPFLAQR